MLMTVSRYGGGICRRKRSQWGPRANGRSPPLRVINDHNCTVANFYLKTQQKRMARIKRIPAGKLGNIFKIISKQETCLAGEKY